VKQTRIKRVSQKRRDAQPDIRAWHDAVLGRDRRRCQLPLRYDGSVPIPQCQGQLEAHHIRGRAGPLLTDVDNGVTLCTGHHRFVHGYGQRMAREWGLMGDKVSWEGWRNPHLGPWSA
jgi:hypothetical protein